MDTVTLLRDENPQEWYCNSADYILIVRYQAGMLGIGVGDNEYEAQHEAKVVGMDWAAYNASAKDKEYKSAIRFDDVKEFMIWTYDDDICCDGL